MLAIVICSSGYRLYISVHLHLIFLLTVWFLFLLGVAFLPLACFGLYGTLSLFVYEAVKSTGPLTPLAAR